MSRDLTEKPRHKFLKGHLLKPSSWRARWC